MASNWADPIIEPDEQIRKQLVQEVAYATWALPRSLQVHLLGIEAEEAFVTDISKKLDPTVVESLVNARHRPNRALYYLSRSVEALPMERFRKNELDERIMNIEDMVGACERIFTTPVPLVYTRHTARFLTVWLMTLPMSLWEPFEESWNHIAMIPATWFMALFLFGIEELAIQLEEPFSILNLEGMNENAIGKAVDEFAEWHVTDDIFDYSPRFPKLDSEHPFRSTLQNY